MQAVDEGSRGKCAYLFRGRVKLIFARRLNNSHLNCVCC